MLSSERVIYLYACKDAFPFVVVSNKIRIIGSSRFALFHDLDDDSDDVH